jgi:hypothetical protein
MKAVTPDTYATVRGDTVHAEPEAVSYVKVRNLEYWQTCCDTTDFRTLEFEMRCFQRRTSR